MIGQPKEQLLLVMEWVLDDGSGMGGATCLTLLLKRSGLKNKNVHLIKSFLELKFFGSFWDIIWKHMSAIGE